MLFCCNCPLLFWTGQYTISIHLAPVLFKNFYSLYTWLNNYDFFSKPVESLSEDDIRDYLYYVKTDKQYSHSHLAQAFSAIKYLCRETLEMPISLSALKGAKRDQKLPVVLSQEELKTLFSCVKNIKHRLIFMTTYSAGLRLSEVTHLRASDIDSKRMTIRVQQGKGKKDRYTLLSPALLQQLRNYWKQHRPYPWLFPGRDKNTPLSDASVQSAFRQARIKAGIRKKASLHTLRHSFATHLLEQGTQPLYHQRAVGPFVDFNDSDLSAPAE